MAQQSTGMRRIGVPTFDRGTAAAATSNASVRTFDVIHSSATDGRSASNVRSDLEQAFGLLEVLVAAGTSRLSSNLHGK
jgi:hypothetical protein